MKLKGSRNFWQSIEFCILTTWHHLKSSQGISPISDGIAKIKADIATQDLVAGSSLVKLDGPDDISAMNGTHQAFNLGHSWGTRKTGAISNSNHQRLKATISSLFIYSHIKILLKEWTNNSIFCQSSFSKATVLHNPSWSGASIIWKKKDSL